MQRFAADGSNPTVIVPKGTVMRPQGLAVVGSRLIVADDWRHKLAVFDTGGRFLRNVGDGEGARPNQFFHPYDVAVDPSGASTSPTTPTTGSSATARRRRTSTARAGAPSGPAAGSCSTRAGSRSTAAGRTFVADPGGNRIDVFDIGGTSQGSFGKSGREAGQFIRPQGVGADASGLRAIADTVNGRIQLVNADGSVAAMFGAPAPGPTLLPDPVAVAFDGSGLLYVVDQERSRVIVFDREGKIIRTIGSRGRGPGQLLAPSAVAVDAAGRVYVADTGNGRIVRFTTAGTHLGSFGRFRTIRGIAVTPDGARVYGVRRGDGKITVMTGTGGDLAEIGARGSEPGELHEPAGSRSTARATSGSPTAATTAIQAFSPDGVLVARFGERGVGAGQFIEPTSVSVACNGLVTVADADNNRAQQFQFPPSAACSSLPAVKNPPDPILYNQPQPLPPEVTVRPTRSTGILAIRQLPLRVSSDLPARISIQVTLKPRSGKRRPSVRMSFSPQNLPAGKTVTYRPRLSAAGVRTLRRALGSRRGLVAEIRVVATNADSSDGVVTQRINVTG